MRTTGTNGVPQMKTEARTKFSSLSLDTYFATISTIL